VFLHRPYRRMAENGLAFLYLQALALGDEDDAAELHALAETVGGDIAALREELLGQIDLRELVAEGNLSAEMYPQASMVARNLRSTARFSELMTCLGDAQVCEVGNLYTASLPAWISAGLEAAAAQGLDWSGRELLAAGYGSGDAAELIAMRLVPGWQQQAMRMEFAQALDGASEVDADTYAGLHDGTLSVDGLSRNDVFYIDRLGRGDNGFDDTGIEYYRQHIASSPNDA